MHLNRPQLHLAPKCQLYTHPYESAEHHFIECSALKDIRKLSLAHESDKISTLNKQYRQLMNMCMYNHEKEEDMAWLWW